MLLAWFAFCLPSPLFDDPTCTVIEDGGGQVLAAKLADDEQWRFPESDSLPDKFVKAITCFEDEYFFRHPGINPVSMFRALRQNLKAGKIVSGGSTITMQTIRLSRQGQRRTVLEKAIEVFQALRMEITYSKQEILLLYASHAPFGSNVVGLETASWRYFGRSSSKLSWGEITALAVLPNAPALIYPGKNHERFLQKRNRLLDKLYLNGEIDAETCELAKSEPLPGRPYAIPQKTPHLLDRAIHEGHKGKRVVATIDNVLQEKVNRIVSDYHAVLSQNEIHNIAAIVIDVKTGRVLAYAGNSNCPDEGSGKDVDVIMAPRSTGSIMKPFLYAFMLQDGAILPHSIVPDIPTQISGYAPKNFDESFDGAVPASEALARSLNIPAVRMLQEYGLERFYDHLKNMNLHTINRPVNYYGLSIILGGAEATLWDLCNEYMRMAQTLDGSRILPEATYLLEDSEAGRKQGDLSGAFEPGSVWWTFEALSTLNRPWQEYGWQEFQSSQKIAWKTGTSFGHRDGWAIGVTPDHVVGVWTGNADGEGRPGLTGLSVAAPILFKIFKHLHYNEWFRIPSRKLKFVTTCLQSGYLASRNCGSTRGIMVPSKGKQGKACTYCETIHLDQSKKYRVGSDCYPVHEMKTASWFVLPPVQEWYYKKKNPFYASLPPYKEGCQPKTTTNMAVIYPKDFTHIFVPRELNGTMGKAIFEIVHRMPESTIYWHLDETYIGSTRSNHRVEVSPRPGNHIMTIVDEKGESIRWNFEVESK